jgi:FKBP-type peptidyl-prolyl cis-trans isomerase
MKKLSFSEWIGVAAGILFVSYMLFGGTIKSAFKKSTLAPENNGAAAVNSTATNTNTTNVNEGSSIQTKDLVIGTGAPVEKGMVVSVNYVLKLSDGTLVQDSKQVSQGQPFQYLAGAGQLIPGWEMGVQGMRVGGKRVITIPPELGYGAQQAGPIPPNSTLVFEIEVVDAKPLTQSQQQQ